MKVLCQNDIFKLSMPACLKLTDPQGPAGPPQTTLAQGFREWEDALAGGATEADREQAGGQRAGGGEKGCKSSRSVAANSASHGRSRAARCLGRTVPCGVFENGRESRS